MISRPYKNKAFVPFLSLGVIVLFLIVISIVDRLFPFENNVYTSPLALLLWSVLAISAVVYIIQRKLYKRVSVFLLHLAFLFMLLGAFLTHVKGFDGFMHIREGAYENHLLTEEGVVMGNTLPFGVRLDSFSVITYPGTNTPADYQSRITLYCEGTSRCETVAMNQIVKYDGYRIFQQSYDPDLKGTVFRVSYDKWGVRLTYLSYILLMISMILILLDPQSKFRQAIKSPLWKTMVVVALISPFTIEKSFAESSTFTEVDAEAFGNILVEYQGRITSMEHVAIDFTKKLTGKDHYGNYSATQVLVGWLMSREEWQYEPMIKLKGKEQKQLLGVDTSHVRFVDFFTADKRYKLRTIYTDVMNGAQKDLRKSVLTLDEKVELILMLQSGSLIKIFPVRKDGVVRLYSPDDFKKGEAVECDSLLINNFLPLLYDSYSRQEDCSQWINQFIKYQEQQLGESAPTQNERRAEKLYLHANWLPIVSYITLTVGLLAFIFLCVRGGNKRMNKLLFLFLSVVFFNLTYLFVLRWIIAGRLPFSNGYETLLTIAWMAQLVALAFSNKLKVILPFGILISGFAMLTATLSDKDPHITPLMPVLNSPLLSIHVSLMMISYTLLFFVTFSSLSALITYWIKKEEKVMERHKTLNIVLLYPAIFCLTAGIFTGAVWANVSWGSYWSWDPKETWALISLLVYSFSFHTESISFLRRPKFFHIYMVIAFLFILITYFGVNYLFGGMHSYGN